MNTKYLAGIVSVNRMKPGNSIGNQITNLAWIRRNMLIRKAG